VRGEPDAEELAALVAALAARTVSGGVARPRPPRSAWSDPARLVRRAVAVGPDGWRRSAQPGQPLT
jgi:hypothetical protein